MRLLMINNCTDIRLIQKNTIHSNYLFVLRDEPEQSLRSAKFNKTVESNINAKTFLISNSPKVFQ